MSPLAVGQVLEIPWSPRPVPIHLESFLEVSESVSYTEGPLVRRSHVLRPNTHEVAPLMFVNQESILCSKTLLPKSQPKSLVVDPCNLCLKGSSKDTATPLTGRRLDNGQPDEVNLLINVNLPSHRYWHRLVARRGPRVVIVDFLLKSPRV